MAWSPRPRSSSRAWVLRPALGALACTAVLLMLAACAPTEQPVRSPLDDGEVQPTAPPGSTFPPPFDPPFQTPTSPRATPTQPQGAGDREAMVAAAIDAFADRSGLPAARFSLAEAEAETWPDGCLGVEVPGLACTEALVPGFRVVLRYQTGSLHEVRTGRPGQIAWAPQRTLEATVEEAGGTLMLVDDAGDRHHALVTPGTRLVDVEPGDLAPGDRVRLGVDDLLDGTPLRVAWLAPGE